MQQISIPVLHPVLHLGVLAEPNHDSFHVFGGSSVPYQKVNHTFRFYHQVAPEKKYTEHDSERQHAQHCDLHHTHDEEFALVLQQHQGPSAVAGHHAIGCVARVRSQGPGEALTTVKHRVLGHVEEGNIHVLLWLVSNKVRDSSW